MRRSACLRGQHILGGNSRDALADIAHHPARHDRLVVDEDAEIVLAGHIVAGDDAAIAGRNASASLTSMDLIRAWACGLRSTCMCSMSGITMSPA